MSIRFSKYVNIISGVGANVAVAQRDLIGRIFSGNQKISPDAVLEFTDAAGVGTYFGTNTDEYRRAAFYFAYVSPAISAPRKLSFARVVPSGGVAPMVFGGKITLAAADMVALSMSPTIFLGSPTGGSSFQASPDYTGVTTYAGIATALQTAFRALDAAKLSLTTIEFDPVASAFNAVFVGSDGTVNDIGLSIPDVADNQMVGWFGTNPAAIVTSGSSGDASPVDAFNRSRGISNNFGSFLFNMTGEDALNLTQNIAVAQANAALNVTYQYMIPVSRGNAVAYSAALIGIAGTAVTLGDPALTNEFPEMVPMIQLAATDYTRRNATINYMFKQFGGLSPMVTTDAESDQMDALRINYYGRTQQAGRTLDFYQRGYLMGSGSAPLDMNVYANEQWLKDVLGARLMSLLMSEGRVPANSAGRGQVLAVLQDGIDQALFNGTISVGKTLTTAQKLLVTEQTGDALALHQIQDIGYWVDARIEPFTGPGGNTEFKAIYVLLYGKDDAVRMIDGQHILI